MTPTELTQEEIRELRPSLKELVDARFIALERTVDLRFAALEKAVEIAKTSMDTRLDAMNEFRSSMTDQANRYLTKTEHEAWKDKVMSDIQMLREFKVTIDGKASQKALTLSYILSAIGLGMGLFSLILSAIKLYGF